MQPAKQEVCLADGGPYLSPVTMLPIYPGETEALSHCVTRPRSHSW